MRIEQLLSRIEEAGGYVTRSGMIWVVGLGDMVSLNYISQKRVSMIAVTLHHRLRGVMVEYCTSSEMAAEGPTNFRGQGRSLEEAIDDMRMQIASACNPRLEEENLYGLLNEAMQKASQLKPVKCMVSMIYRSVGYQPFEALGIRYPISGYSEEDVRKADEEVFRQIMES